MIEVAIDTLPKNITVQAAIEQNYAQEIAKVVERLNQGMSVGVHCQKQMIPFLQTIIKKRLIAEGKEFAIIDGREDGVTSPQSRTSRMVQQFMGLLNHGDPRKIFSVPYLDILTSTAQGSLSSEGREILTIIHENPFLVLLSFEDPDFPLADIIRQAFSVQIKMIGIHRQKMHLLVTQAQAKKFGFEKINFMHLYKYMSGLNPIKMLLVLKIFESKADYNPQTPTMLEQYYREMREHTTGNADISTIHLDRDIAGYDSVKETIHKEILGLLKKMWVTTDEDTLSHLEQLLPHGMILYGPPGTGKTLFAKGIAEALNATFHPISGPELKSKWVGQGEANIRQLFARARASAPAVILFDEFDAIAHARSNGSSDGASEAQHSMVNQLLTEMDGFRKEDWIFVIATTNFMESLDKAFLRPGRFELYIEVDYPKRDDRLSILSLYNRKLETNLTEPQLEFLADWTTCDTEANTPHTGDHLNALLRSLKRHLVLAEQSFVSIDELKTWLLTQSQLTPIEEKVVAIHEAGHALMIFAYGRQAEIDRISIESRMRSNTLGSVQRQLNGNILTQEHLRQEMGILLGGYYAEKLFFNQTSSGASSDIQRATNIAQMMVAELAMGIEIPRSYMSSETHDLHPYAYPMVSAQLDVTLSQIGKEVFEYLSTHREQLEKLSEHLITQRTLLPKDLADFF